MADRPSTDVTLPLNQQGRALSFPPTSLPSTLREFPRVRRVAGGSSWSGSVLQVGGLAAGEPRRGELGHVDTGRGRYRFGGDGCGEAFVGDADDVSDGVFRTVGEPDSVLHDSGEPVPVLACRPLQMRGLLDPRPDFDEGLGAGLSVLLGLAAPELAVTLPELVHAPVVFGYLFLDAL